MSYEKLPHSSYPLSARKTCLCLTVGLYSVADGWWRWWRERRSRILHFSKITLVAWKLYFRDLSIPAWPVFHNVTLVLKVVIYLLNIRIEEFLYWSCVERVPRRKKLYAMFEELVTRRKSISTVSRCLLSEQLVTQHLVIINYLLQINTMKCTFFCKFFECWFYLTLILRKGNSCA